MSTPMKSPKAADDFLVLHERTETPVGPRLRDPFAAWLDQADDAAAAARAYARLAEDEPDLHAAVQAYVVERLSSREAALRCGVRHKAVLARKERGLALLRQLYRFEMADGRRCPENVGEMALKR